VGVQQFPLNTFNKKRVRPVRYSCGSNYHFFLFFIKTFIGGAWVLGSHFQRSLEKHRQKKKLKTGGGRPILKQGTNAKGEPEG
jgi:hypothetical protein